MTSKTKHGVKNIFVDIVYNAFLDQKYHVICSYSYKSICVTDWYGKLYKTYFGEDAIDKFLNHMIK